MGNGFFYSEGHSPRLAAIALRSHFYCEICGWETPIALAMARFPSPHFVATLGHHLVLQGIGGVTPARGSVPPTPKHQNTTLNIKTKDTLGGPKIAPRAVFKTALSTGFGTLFARFSTCRFSNGKLSPKGLSQKTRGLPTARPKFTTIDNPKTLQLQSPQCISTAIPSIHPNP